jgi:hypothetical protein
MQLIYCMRSAGERTRLVRCGPQPSPTARVTAGRLPREVSGEVVTRASSPEPESEMASSTFRDFLSLGAGVTPAEGSVKPTAGFTFN